MRSAAMRLGMAQPSLSKSIQQLEESLGTVLFYRSAKGIVLTPTGHAFLGHAELAWNELMRGKNEVLQLSGDSEGSLAIGVSATPALIGLADALKAFRREFAHVQIRIVAGHFPSVLPELRAGTLDFSIGPRPLFGIGDEYVVETLFQNTRVVVCRKGHPLAEVGSLSGLLEAEWIVTGATGEAKADFERFFRRHSLPAPEVGVRCEYVTAILALLTGTDMLALLPRQWVESDVTKQILEHIPVSESLQDADICLIYRNGFALTPEAKAFLTLIRRECEYYCNLTSAPEEE